MNRNKLSILLWILVFALLCVLVLCIQIRNYNNPKPTEPTDESTAQNLTTQADTTQAQPDTTEEATETTEAETTETTVEETTEPEETTLPEDTTAPVLAVGDAIAKLAMDQIGKSYSYGGAGPDSFDTSGLIYYCYVQNEVSVPRTTGPQSTYGIEVSKENLAPGDAVYFWSSKAGLPEYGGIYVGGGMVVCAMNSSKPVTQFNMNSEYYTQHFVCARRLYG